MLESQIRNETSKFDVDEQRVERDLIERGFDKLLGREEAIQEEAAKKYVKDLTNTAERVSVELVMILQSLSLVLLVNYFKKPKLVKGIKNFKTNVANGQTAY